MNEIEVSSIDLVEGGNVFKQGHYLTLGYIPRDESGAVVDLTGKTLSVTLWGRKGIGFESDAVYADGVLRFTLNKTIIAGEYNVEFTATSSTDATYRKKFPTSASSGRIVVRQSADDLGSIGVSVVTAAQFRAEFDQAINALPVDSEINLARVATDGTVYPHLPARLEAEQQETVSLLADKASKEELANVLDGTPKGTYATVAALQAAFPTGTTGVYIVAADGNIYSWNGSAWVSRGLYQAVGIADGSVSLQKTDFITLGTNLFNKADPEITDGYYYNYLGVLTASATSFITGKMYVKPNDVFIFPYSSAAFADANWGTYFDGAGTRIANVGTTVSGSHRIITVPNNAAIKYMRVNNILNLKDALMIVAGNVYPTAYVPFSRKLKDDVNTLEIARVENRVDSFDGYFVDSVNLFDKDSADNQQGFFINYQGVKTALAGHFISHLKPTIAGETLAIKYYPSSFGTNPMAQYYDADGNYLSFLKGVVSEDTKSATFVTPSNAAIRFVKMNGVTADIGNLMVVKGTALPSYYVPFEKYLNEKFSLNERQRAKLNPNPLSRKIAVFDGDSICNAINDAQDGYAGRIASKNEIAYTNYAVDGGTITAGTMAGANPRHWVSRSVAGYRSDADYIILEGGTNDADLLGVGNLGTISVGFDAVLDDTTFSGAVESTLKQAILKYKRKKIGFIIAHKMGTLEQQAIRKAFFDRIMEICRKWGVKYINLWEESYLNPLIPELKTLYYSDFQHLTSIGYDDITPLIEDWMKTL